MNLNHQEGLTKVENADSIQRRFLVVEDEPAWQLILRRLLKDVDQRIEIFFADSFEGALSVLDENISFEGIIADFNLNGTKNGLDLWDALNVRKSEVPYVLVSGTRREDFFASLMPYREAMVPTFLEKSNDSLSELSERLRTVLGLCASLPKVRLNQEPEAISEVQNQASSKRNNLWFLVLALTATLFAASMGERLRFGIGGSLTSVSQVRAQIAFQRVFNSEVRAELMALARDRSVLEAVERTRAGR